MELLRRSRDDGMSPGRGAVLYYLTWLRRFCVQMLTAMSLRCLCDVDDAAFCSVRDSRVYAMLYMLLAGLVLLLLCHVFGLADVSAHCRQFLWSRRCVLMLCRIALCHHVVVS